jgi:probable rRNA maturation factor
VIVNLQKRFTLPNASLALFARNLKRRLRLGKQEFNICFVDDAAICHLNAAYRGKDKPTDVLSFPWNEAAGPPGLGTPEPAHQRGQGGITNFLGDIVISVEMARRNAAEEGHSTVQELRWLILHGVLHLLGYDHEHDTGEMITLELALREKLGVTGERRKLENRKSKIETRKPKLASRKSKLDSRKSRIETRKSKLENRRPKSLRRGDR